MGIESILKVAAPVVGGLLGSKGSKQSGSSTTTTQQQLDPRISNMLFGTNGQQGLLGQYQDLLKTPQSGAAQNLGTAYAGYVGNAGADLDAVRNTAYKSMGTTPAPMATTANISGPAWATGNMVQAPSQNNIDLTGSYQNLLSGGDTSKLMSSLQAGNALTNEQLRQNQASLTDNFQKTVLPSIRGGAIAAGQYGGSRQGIAEGNAISDLTKQLSNTNTQVGLANSANTASALAGAYESGQNRALSATQGLGAQQYNVAQQDAATKNAAEFMNVGTHNNVLDRNASMQQQTNLANLQSQLTTNAQNNGQNLAGAGLLSGLLGNVGQQVNANDNYSLNRAQGVNSLLAPYLSVNQSSTSSTPQYQNTLGNLLGGAQQGIGLFNSLKGLF
jgi:hypothetical protein